MDTKYRKGKLRYFRIFLLHFQQAFEQRDRSLVWFILAVLNPLLVLVFWLGVYHNKTGTLEGWGLSAITSYYFLLIIASSFLMTHHEQDVAVLDIQEGGLVKYLLKPFSYYWIYFTAELGWRVLQGIFALVVFLALSFLFSNSVSFATSLQILLLAAISIMFGYFISFTFKTLLGLSAFWVTDFWGIQQFSEVIILALAGFLMPIDLFPPLMQKIALLTPFPYMVYYPLVAIQGKLQLLELFQVIAIQAIWLTALILMYRWMWRSGIKKFTGVGQ